MNFVCIFLHYRSQQSQSRKWYWASKTEETEKRQKTQNSLHKYTAHRSWKEISPAKIPFSSWESRVCGVPEADRDTGQNLVPESKGQGKASAWGWGREGCQELGDSPLVCPCLPERVSPHSTPASATRIYCPKYHAHVLCSHPIQHIPAWPSDSLSSHHTDASLSKPRPHAVSSSKHEIRHPPYQSDGRDQQWRNENINRLNTTTHLSIKQPVAR